MAHTIAGHADGARAVLAPDIVEAAARATELFPRILAQAYAAVGVPDRACPGSRS